jgi:hypothetical protein
MPDINSLTELAIYVQNKINSALNNEVAETARKEMQIQIENVVYSYDAAQPDLRRMYNDGLIDPKNIEIQIAGDDSISIENIAYDGIRNVPYIVETGQGYYAGASDELTRGRKFTEATKEGLRQGKFKLSMIKGLKRQGIDTI